MDATRMIPAAETSRNAMDPAAEAGGHAVFIETYGCAFNAADGEAMAGVLQRAGHRVVSDPSAADVIIVNTCTVKDRTYLNFEKRFRRLKAAALAGEGPRLVVAGCIPKAYERSDLLAGVAALGPDAIGRVNEVVEQAMRGGAPHVLRGERQRGAPRERLPTARRNPLVEILPIASGCLSACSFCQTRLARGRLRSFRPSDLVEKARRGIDEGVREIWITSQDVGAYGREAGYTLTGLVGRIAELPGDFRIRLGMTSPQWVSAELEAWLDLLDHPRLFRFLHIPVQSGADGVLRAMGRENTVAEFEAVCEAMLARHPDLALMTDLIVGFPTETEADFAETLALVERVPFATVNRSRFSARPGTAAARLTGLPGAVVTERSSRLNVAVRVTTRRWHERLVGRRERVLTFESDPAGRRTLAHNGAWRPVVLPGVRAVGEWLDVEYVGAADFHLKGRPVTI